MSEKQSKFEAREREIAERIAVMKKSLHKFVAGEPVLSVVYATLEVVAEVVPHGDHQDMMIRDIFDECMGRRSE